MNKVLTSLAAALTATLVLHDPVGAAPAGAKPAQQQTAIPGATGGAATRDQLNAWTVGIAGGPLEGAPIRFVSDIARVVDDGENLTVLPIVSRGPAENINSLLYQKGIDAAVIYADALEEFKAKVPDIDKRVTYLLNLFPSELHVFVRPEIKSLEDLAGKKVNFNTKGTAAAYSGALIFDRLGVPVEKTFIPHQVALEKMKKGEDDFAAIVFITGKPIDTFVKGKWEPGFKFLPVEYGSKFEDYYMPSTIDSSDYPNLIPPGERIPTIAAPTILAAFNWAKNSDRYRRLARLTDYLFDRLDTLREPGYHPKWKDVNPAAVVPGLQRFPAAQEWLERKNAEVAGRKDPTRTGTVETTVDPAVIRAQAARAAPGNTAEQERLFREFMDWKKQRRP